MKLISLIAALITITNASRYTTTQRSTTTRKSTTTVTNKHDEFENKYPAFREFDLEVFKGLRNRQPGIHNLVFSPASIRTVLAMLKDGSAGITRENLEVALGETSRPTSLLFPRSQNDGLDVANALFLSSRLTAKQSYQTRLSTKYNAWLEYSDFSRPRSAADKINEWVYRATKGHIRQIVNRDSVSSDTVLLVANAVHLHGKWSNPFPEGNTKLSTFYEGFCATNSSSTQVPMMSQFNYFKAAVVEDLNAKVLEMPFLEPEGLSMLIILPLKIGGLLNLIDNLNPESLRHIYDSLPELPTITSVQIPKFTAYTSQPLIDILPRNVSSVLGVDGDFSGITQNGERIGVSQALHFASLSVDEKGAEASAVSAITAILLHSGSPFEFHAKHPFIYMIVDTRDADAGHIEPIFMGYVTRIDNDDNIQSTSTHNPTRIYFQKEQRSKK